MKIRCKIDPTAEEPELLVIAPARTAAVDALLSRLAQCAAPPITAYDGQRALVLQCDQILRFFADGKGVCVQMAFTRSVPGYMNWKKPCRGSGLSAFPTVNSSTSPM